MLHRFELFDSKKKKDNNKKKNNENKDTHKANTQNPHNYPIFKFLLKNPPIEKELTLE
jgi:hypothetical protein